MYFGSLNETFDSFFTDMYIIKFILSDHDYGHALTGVKYYSFSDLVNSFMMCIS